MSPSLFAKLAVIEAPNSFNTGCQLGVNRLIKRGAESPLKISMVVCHSL